MGDFMVEIKECIVCSGPIVPCCWAGFLLFFSFIVLNIKMDAWETVASASGLAFPR